MYNNYTGTMPEQTYCPCLGGEIGNGSLTEGGKASGNEGLTVINVMDFQREFDRALASTRGRRVLINILGEEGIAS